MNSIALSLIKATLLVYSAAGLEGCALAILATSAAPLVGGVLPGDNTFVVDEASVSPELRTSLASARKLTFIGTDKSDSYMAEYLDRNGAFVAELEEAPKGSTPSQTRKLMQGICARKDKPDMVFSSSLGESDAGTGTTLKGIFTGRTELKVAGVLNFLRCKDNWATSIKARVELNQGNFNADQTKMSQVVGQEAAKAIMRLAGKLPPVPAK